MLHVGWPTRQGPSWGAVPSVLGYRQCVLGLGLTCCSLKYSHLGCLHLWGLHFLTSKVDLIALVAFLSHPLRLPSRTYLNC